MTRLKRITLDAPGVHAEDAFESPGEEDITKVSLLREAPTLRDVSTAPESGPRTAPTDPTRSRSSVFAHEIRNSLHRAMLHLMLLDREHERIGAGVDALHPAAGVRSEVLRITKVVNDYLDWMRHSEQGAGPLSLRQACTRALEAMAPAAAAADLEIASELDGEAPAGCDLSATEQVVGHVLRCAVGSAPAASKILLFAHGTAADAIVELSWELPPSPPGTGALEEMLTVVSKYGGTVEIRTSPERSLVCVALPVVEVREKTREG
jgi:hypothetical protein